LKVVTDDENNNSKKNSRCLRKKYATTSGCESSFERRNFGTKTLISEKPVFISVLCVVLFITQCSASKTLFAQYICHLSFTLTMDNLKKAYQEAANKVPKGSMPAPGAGGRIGKVLGLGFGLGLGAYGVYNSMFTVTPGHAAVIYNRFGLGGDSGIQSVVCKEGLNFVLPCFQRPIIYDVRTRPKLINSTSGSKDLQMVEIALRVLYKPDSAHLPFIYRRLGKDFDERVLPSIVNEVTKAVVARFNASELLTKRDQVSALVLSMLTKRAADFHILLDDVSITHLAFSKDYTAAVEAKQVHTYTTTPPHYHAMCR
jgi:hypothetical protein